MAVLGKVPRSIRLILPIIGHLRLSGPPVGPALFRTSVNVTPCFPSGVPAQ